MNQLIAKARKNVSLHIYWNAILTALALHTRGEVRNDGLSLIDAVNTLEITWHARDIHPCDRSRNLTGEQQAQLFLDRTLADTDAAIQRIFAALPQIDAMKLRVLAENSQKLLIFGTVSRFRI